jgi:hypothetical protein
MLQEYDNTGSLGGKCNTPALKDNSNDVIQVTASLTDASAGLKCQVKGDDFSDSNR